MEFADVARTTFTAREFTAEPVSDDALASILDIARFAPSGGNRQGWHVVVVRDSDTKARLAELCRPAWNVYAAQVRAGEAPWNTVHPTTVDLQAARSTDQPSALLDGIERVPVVLVITVDRSVVASVDQLLDRPGVVAGASIYPFVWNLLLAARDQGLSGALTTFLAGSEPEAQHLLGIPPHHAIAAMVPIGHPVQVLTRLRRRPVAEFATLERFDGPPLSG